MRGCLVGDDLANVANNRDFLPARKRDAHDLHTQCMVKPIFIKLIGRKLADRPSVAPKLVFRTMVRCLWVRNPKVASGNLLTATSLGAKDRLVSQIFDYPQGIAGSAEGLETDHAALDR